MHPGDMLQWWEMAYTESELAERFFMEAESALPLLDDGSRDLGEIFEALQHQRARLKFNQQLAEWDFSPQPRRAVDRESNVKFQKT